MAKFQIQSDSYEERTVFCEFCGRAMGDTSCHHSDAVAERNEFNLLPSLDGNSPEMRLARILETLCRHVEGYATKKELQRMLISGGFLPNCYATMEDQSL